MPACVNGRNPWRRPDAVGAGNEPQKLIGATFVRGDFLITADGACALVSVTVAPAAGAGRIRDGSGNGAEPCADALMTVAAKTQQRKTAWRSPQLALI